MLEVLGKEMEEIINLTGWSRPSCLTAQLSVGLTVGPTPKSHPELAPEVARSTGQTTKGSTQHSSTTKYKMSEDNASAISLVQSFQALYNKRAESDTTDLTVVCQDGSEIPVHSLVLSTR